MLTLIFPTLLLLASAAVAQEETPSVVTSIAISPTPTTEEVFTIQTSTPSASDPWACYVDCLMPPCTTPASCMQRRVSILIAVMLTPIGLTGSLTSVPPVSDTVVSVITDPSLSTVTGIMSIPPLETPVSTGVMSIPAGETPISTGSLDTPAPSTTTMSSSSNLTASATSSGPAEQTTNAAASVVKRDGVPLMIVIAGALALL
jgi:hypothetical protein